MIETARSYWYFIFTNSITNKKVSRLLLLSVSILSIFHVNSVPFVSLERISLNCFLSQIRLEENAVVMCNKSSFCFHEHLSSSARSALSALCPSSPLWCGH